MYIISLILITVAVFARTINFGLVVDDIDRLHRPKEFTVWWRKILASLRGSATSYFPLKVDHIVTLTLHVIAVCLVYIMFGQGMRAFLGALMFAIHPCNTQGSVWLNGKRYVISTIIVVIMMTWPVWSPLFLLVPMFQLNAIFAPLLHVYHGSWGLLAVFGVMGLLLFNHIKKRFQKRMRCIPPGELSNVTPKKIVLFFKVFSKYFWHCLIPYKPAFHHFFMEDFGFSKEENDAWYSCDARYVVGLFTFGIIMATIFGTWGTPLAYGLFWFTLFITQWCHLYKHATQNFCERYLYLPSIGLMMAVAATAPILVSCALVGYYLALTVHSTDMYKNMGAFFHYNLSRYPTHFTLRSRQVMVLIKMDDIPRALASCKEGLIYRPDDFGLNICAIHIGHHMQRPAMMIEHIKKAFANYPVGTYDMALRSFGQWRDLLNLTDQQCIEIWPEYKSGVSDDRNGG